MEKGFPIIRIRDLKEQKVATYTTEKHPKGYLLQAGDIDWNGRRISVPYIWGTMKLVESASLRIQKQAFKREKASFILQSNLFFAIEQTQVATTVIHIGKRILMRLKSHCQTLGVLDSFDAITTPMVEKIVENRFEIKQLNCLRDALLPKP